VPNPFLSHSGTARSSNTRRRSRRRLAALALAAAVVATAACEVQFVAPEGDAPLRYRDEVFTTVTKTEDVTYGWAWNQEQVEVTLKVDVYRPDGDTETKRPLLILVHGGSFKTGSKTSPELVDQANVFAKKGYVTASISYRLSKGGCLPVTAQCPTAILHAKHDALAAVRYFRANAGTYGIDTERIAITGSSAGAITAVNVAYGADDPGNSGTSDQPSTVRAATSLSGCAITTSPSAGEAPVLYLHGSADVVVQYQCAISSRDAALAAGLEANFTTLDGGGHVPYVAFRTTILDHTTNFLYWKLDLEHT